jgi:hypothetical protein
MTELMGMTEFLSLKTRQETVTNVINGLENLIVSSFDQGIDVQNVQKMQNNILYSFRNSTLQRV